MDAVVINKGKRENIKIGSMFSILQPGPAVLVDDDAISYQEDASTFAQIGSPDTVIPAERVGELMILKVYEKVSIALVMRSTNLMSAHYKIQGIEF